MLNSIIASIRSTAEMFAELGIEFNYSALAISTLVSSILFLAVGYAFRSVGVYVMSKRQGLSTPWLSFVPFLGYVQLGKLIGPASICGIRMKNTGWAMFAFLFADKLVNFIYDLLYCWKDFLYIVTQNKIPAVTEAVLGEYIISGISVVTSLCYIVMFVFTVILFFRYYSKNSVAGFAILSLLLEFMFGILVFVCRNNDKKDLAAERRAFEEKMRSRGGFYGSSTGGSYRGQDEGGFRPYGSDTDGEKKESSPFSEYSDTTKNDDVFEEYSTPKKDDKDKEDDLF